MTPAASGRRTFFLVAGIFYLGLAIAGLLWLGAQRGRIGLALFFEPRTVVRELVAGLVLGGALLALWWTLRRFVPAARELESQVAALVAPLGRAEALGLAWISALAEEVFFRGALQGAVGWLPAAALFALLHTGRGRAFRAWGIFALAAGLLLGGYVAWGGALGGAIVAHALVNGVNLLRLSGASARAEGARDD